MSVRVDPTEFAGKRLLVCGGPKGHGRATVDHFRNGGGWVITGAYGTPEHIDGVEFVQADLTTAMGGELLAKPAHGRVGGVNVLTQKRWWLGHAGRRP